MKKQGYRVIIVERHLVFYKFNREEKTVIIYAIITEEKDVETYLKEYTDYYLKRYVGNYDNMINSHISDVQLYNLYAQSLDKNISLF